MVGPQLCVSPTAGGRTGPRKGWGEEGKKRRKTYKKMIGEAKNIDSKEIQSFGILKTCKKRKKVRGNCLKQRFFYGFFKKIWGEVDNGKILKIFRLKRVRSVTITDLIYLR